MKPTRPITDEAFVWIPSASHSDPQHFRERMKARIRAQQKAAQAQAQAPNVTALPVKAKAST